jgi:outer membrane protein OmpA-like peptidoglycan-associated protein
MNFSLLKRHTLIFLGLLPVLTLTACHHQSPKPSGLIIAKQPPTLVQEIRFRGAQIIQQGARLQIILPTDQFFRAASTELRGNSIKTMKLIALYLKGYLQQFHTNTPITVAGYTDQVFNKRKQYKLSHQYAQVITSYLWNQGFSQTKLRPLGFGSTHTIANPKTMRGSAYNRRVVIQVN